MMSIWRRKQELVNTDPQRRCYNGALFSYEMRWTEWEEFETNIPENEVEQRLQFWRELSDYAVSQRGATAETQYSVRN